MKFVDYYKVMGVEPDADAATIKQAYRRLARKYHPDVSKEGDAEARFKEINEAWQVLRDPERRREYDELRRYGHAGEDFTPPPGWHSRHPFEQGGSADFDMGDYADLSDFFSELFTRAGQQRGTSRSQHAGGADPFSRHGRDQHAHLDVSLRDAFHGATLPLTLRSPNYRSDGSVQMEEKTLQVKLPAGVREGQQLRLRGQGAPGYGTDDAGDLYIEIGIRAEPPWHLDGRDIELTVPVYPWEAALGGSIRVPTLAGPVNLTLPANSKTGRRLRLKGRGMPGKTPGDQYVILSVIAPEARTDAQRDAYAAMKDLWKDDPRTRLGA